MNNARAARIVGVSTFTSQGDRPIQEDHVLVDKDKGIFVVSDGFGGAAAGVAASKTGCEAVRKFLFKEAGDAEATMPFVLRPYFSLAGNVLFNALMHANQQVRLLNRGKNVNERGGASVIAGLVDGDLIALASVGCCHALLLREGRSIELVHARTYARLRDPFEHRSIQHEMQVPLMALGMSEDLEPEIFEFKIEAGDWILLHTDGLTQSAQEEIMEIKNRHVSGSSVTQVGTVLNKVQSKDNTAVSLIVF